MDGNSIYHDNHDPIEEWYSLVVIRDSKDQWFYSDYHFCGYLASYRHTIMGKSGLTKEDIETNFAGIHAIATSLNLATARKNLRALNFRRLKK